MGKILSMILLISILLLAGCKEHLPEYTLEVPTATEGKSETAGTEATEPKEYREYATYPLEGGTERGEGNLYYDTYSRLIRYYDTEMRRTVTLCNQPNCIHSDSKCSAYLGDEICTNYSVAGDLVYAIVENSDNGGERLFIERNMITGENRILWDMTTTDWLMREHVEFSIYKNVAFLTFYQYELHFDENGTGYEKNSVQYSYELDLTTCERKLLMESDVPNLEGFRFNGSRIVPRACTEAYLVIQEVTYHEDVLIPMEEYLKTNPDGDYGLYIIENYQTESHYAVDRESGERKDLCGGVKEAALIDLDCVRDRNMAFADGGNVYLFDGETGKISLCFQEKNVVLLRCYDGRIFYNTKELGEDQQPVWRHFWFDLQTGERKELKRTMDPSFFSVHGEMTDYFYGVGDGKHYISKQDFYNENYDAAF